MAVINYKKIIFKSLLFTVLTLSSYHNHFGAAERGISHLNPLRDCHCPGDHLTYECSSLGGLATIWRGSALNRYCESGYILLRHRKFNSQNQTAGGECNNGQIRAQSIGVTNSTYISQLNVTVSADMNNMTIECTNEDFNGTIVIVGMEKVIVATGVYYVY